jgi:hypothetical protein
MVYGLWSVVCYRHHSVILSLQIIVRAVDVLREGPKQLFAVPQLQTAEAQPTNPLPLNATHLLYQQTDDREGEGDEKKTNDEKGIRIQNDRLSLLLNPSVIPTTEYLSITHTHTLPLSLALFSGST